MTEQNEAAARSIVAADAVTHDAASINSSDQDARNFDEQTEEVRWLSRLAIALELDIPLSCAKIATDEVMRISPEMFRVTNANGSEVVECQSTVLPQVAERTPPPTGWVRVSELAKELETTTGRIERILPKLYEEFEGSFGRRMHTDDEVPYEYLGPDISQRVKNIVESSKKEPGTKFDEEQQNLEDDFHVFTEEMKSGLTMEAEEFEQLIRLFGPENATDLLYHYKPDFRGVSTGYVKSFLVDYLGEFVVVKGKINFDRVEMSAEFLSNATLRQALTEVLKRDCMATYHSIKRANQAEDDVDIILVYLDDMREQMAGLNNDNLDQVIKDVEDYYFSLFDDFNVPHNFVSGLSEDRPFPDLNQRMNVKEICENKQMLIADDPGLGKSASAIIAKERLGAELAVIVAPGSIVEKRVWQDYLSDRIGEDGEQVGYFKEGEAPRVLVIDSPDSLDGVKKEDYDYIVISHSRLNPKYVPALCDLGIDMLIIDEAHKLKNIESGTWGKQLIELSDSVNRRPDTHTVMLTATPVPNLVSDIAMVMRVLYPQEFAEFSNKELSYKMINGDVLALRSRLVPKMQKKALEDCIDIPPVQEIVEYIELSDAERAVYDFYIEDDEMAFSPKIQACRQILLSAATVEAVPPIPPTKALRVNEILNGEEGFKTKDKIILYINNFVDNIIAGDETIFDYIKAPDGVQVRYIYGDIKKDRYKIQQEFKYSKDKILLVVNGQVADVGIDFSAADEQIFYNPGWTRSERVQQIGRSQRPGRTKSLIVRSLIAANTVEVGIDEYAHNKDLAIRKLLYGIPLTDLDKEHLIRAEEGGPEVNLEVDSELGKHYFSAEQRLNKMFSNAKQQGSQAFRRLVVHQGPEYASTYKELIHRSYQANMARLSGTIIENFVDNGEIETTNPLIVDLGSGPEMLRRHIADRYADNVVSLDMNRDHFWDDLEPSAIVGDIVSLPVRTKTADVVNMGLVLDSTKYLPSKRATDPEALERLEIFKEINRVLKPGGRAVMTQIYSLDLADPDGFKTLVQKMGFKVVSATSGIVHSESDVRGRVITLEKLADCPTDTEELVKTIGSGALPGLKFARVDHRPRNPKKIDKLWRIKGKQPIIPHFNDDDQRVATEEAEILSTMTDHRLKYKKIVEIPPEVIVAGGLSRVKHNNNYVLFKRLTTAIGAVFLKDNR